MVRWYNDYNNLSFGGVISIFYSFPSQTERRKFDGSDFLEMQFCKMPKETKLQSIVSIDNVNHWFDDSLYISGDDINAFLEEYGCIFNCGVYNNLEIGTIDPFGINYYKPELIETIVTELLEVKPTDFEKLLEWLNTAKKYNGFYILGV